MYPGSSVPALGCIYSVLWEQQGQLTRVSTKQITASCFLIPLTKKTPLKKMWLTLLCWRGTKGEQSSSHSFSCLHAGIGRSLTRHQTSVCVVKQGPQAPLRCQQNAEGPLCSYLHCSGIVKVPLEEATWCLLIQNWKHPFHLSIFYAPSSLSSGSFINLCISFWLFLLSGTQRLCSNGKKLCSSSSLGIKVNTNQLLTSNFSFLIPSRVFILFQ